MGWTLCYAGEWELWRDGRFFWFVERAGCEDPIRATFFPWTTSRQVSVYLPGGVECPNCSELLFGGGRVFQLSSLVVAVVLLCCLDLNSGGWLLFQTCLVIIYQPPEYLMKAKAKSLITPASDYFLYRNNNLHCQIKSPTT
jgi:hypothetical protein